MWPGIIQQIANRLLAALANDGSINATLVGGQTVAQGAPNAGGAERWPVDIDQTYLVQMAGTLDQIDGCRRTVGNSQVLGVVHVPTGAGPWTRTCLHGTSTPALANVQVIRNAAAHVRRVHVVRSSGATLWIGLTNTATALTNGAVVETPQSIATGTATQIFDFGETGMYFSAGVCLTLSSASLTFNSGTSVTNVAVTIEWVAA